MDVHHFCYERITFNPEKCFGKACIRGLRIPVSSLLSSLTAGMREADILREWPQLKPEDIRQALAYASEAIDDGVLSLPARCRLL